MTGSWTQVRRPVLVGVLGTVVLGLIAAVAVVLPRLAFFVGTTSYEADFANAAGLSVGDPVHVAGVPAGKVTDVRLDGDHIRVAFRLDKDQPLGTGTTASVKIATLLGRQFIAVQPQGGDRMPAGAVIPLARTSVPFTLDHLGRRTVSTTEQLDLPALQKMIKTLNEVAPKDPGLTGEALRGLSGVAELVTKRKDQIGSLLKGAQTVTSSLLEQQGTLVKLLGDANLVAQTIAARRDTLVKLIADVAGLSRQLTEFLRDHRPALDPMLAQLRTISEALVRNEKALGSTLDSLGPTLRYSANAMGNGKWLDITLPAGPIPDNLLCIAGLVKGCK